MSDQENGAGMLWRIDIPAAVDTETVENAISDAARAAAAKARDVGIGMVHRLDLLSDRTVVFVSANEAGRDDIASALAITCDKGKPRARQAKLEELMSPT